MRLGRRLPVLLRRPGALSRLGQSAPRRRFPQPASRFAHPGGHRSFPWPRAFSFGVGFAGAVLCPRGNILPARAGRCAVAFLAALGD